MRSFSNGKTRILRAPKSANPCKNHRTSMEIHIKSLKINVNPLRIREHPWNPHVHISNPRVHISNCVYVENVARFPAVQQKKATGICGLSVSLKVAPFGFLAWVAFGDWIFRFFSTRQNHYGFLLNSLLKVAHFGFLGLGCFRVLDFCLGVATSTCSHFQNVHMLKIIVWVWPCPHVQIFKMSTS